MSFAAAFPNITAILMGVIYVLKIKNKEIIPTIEPYLKPLVIFLIYVILLSIFNKTIHTDFDEILKILHLILLVPVLYEVKEKAFLIFAFILGVIISSSATLFNIISTTNFNFNDFILDGAIVKEVFITQRLYLGFFLSISTIFCATIFFESNNKIIRKTCLTLGIITTVLIFIFSSRSSIIIWFILLFSVLIFKRKEIIQQKKTLLIFLILIVSLIATNYKTLNKRFFYSGDIYTEKLVDKVIKHEPRFLIWKFSFEIFSENKKYFFGLGNKETDNLLLEKYRTIKNKKRGNWFIERGFNTHNQFLDFMLNYGIIGLIIYLYVFLSYLFSLKENIFLFNLILSLFIFSCLENILNRQLGVYIFAFLLVTSKALSNKQLNE